MASIENIFICLSLPMLMSVFFTKGRSRSFMIFVLIGMLTCVMSAYTSSYFMGVYSADPITTSIEISPVCEEILKLLPLIFYYLIFEPEPKRLPNAAIAIAVGFATFENVCCLTENGAEDFSILLIRGISAGALHMLCGILCGFGISYVFKRWWLAITGTLGILGCCIGFHAIYNLMISSPGSWRMAGYIFPSVLIIVFYILKRIVEERKDKEQTFERSQA